MHISPKKMLSYASKELGVKFNYICEENNTIFVGNTYTSKQYKVIRSNIKIRWNSTPKLYYEGEIDNYFHKLLNLSTQNMSDRYITDDVYNTRQKNQHEISINKPLVNNIRFYIIEEI